MRIASLAASKKAVLKSTAERMVFDHPEKLHPELREWWIGFQKECARVGIPLRVVSGYRDKKTQDRLYLQRRSQKKGGQSAHNYGMAIDVIHTTRAWEDMPQSGWLILHGIGMEVARKRHIKMRWGGDWNGNGVPVPLDPSESFWDAAHWELLAFSENGEFYEPPKK